MPDRAQDTEAIRAARVAADTYRDAAKFHARKRQEAEAERDRLVARLEAAERALLANVGDAYNLLTQGESSTQRRALSAQRIYDRSRAALAAAAPGETTLAE